MLHIGVCVCARACARARGSVHARAWMWPCLSTMQLVCAISWCHFWLLGLQYILRHLSHKRCNFRQKVTEHKMCFDFLYYFCLKHLLSYKYFSKISSKISKRLHVKCPLFLSDFNKPWILPTDFRKKAQISSFIKILPVGEDCSLRTDVHDEGNRRVRNCVRKNCERA